MRRKPVPEVVALFREGRLSQADLMFVSHLRPQSQLAAARKCLRPNPTFAVEYRTTSTITHARSK